MLTSGFIALTLSQQAASILHRLIEAISWLFVTVRIVEFTQDVTTLEKHMRTFAYTTSKTTRGLPGNGMHFLPVFAAVCYKTTVVSAYNGSRCQLYYNVYIPRLKFLVDKFDAMIQAGAESDLIIEYASQISAHQTSFTRVKEMPLGTPRTWQADATNQIVGAFEKSGFGQRCSVLVSGPPGIGKTSLGTFVGMELIKRKMGVTPIVFFFDPTAKGFDFFAALPTGDEDIVVAMLDEYDAIVKYAESGVEQQGNSEYQSMARSENAWLAYLDRLGRTRKVILIATTNTPISELPQKYVRPGRLDIHITADQQQ